MPSNSQSYHDKTEQYHRNGKTGGLHGKPDAKRELGKSYPAGKEARGIKDQSGSIPPRSKKIG